MKKTVTAHSSGRERKKNLSLRLNFSMSNPPTYKSMSRDYYRMTMSEVYCIEYHSNANKHSPSWWLYYIFLTIIHRAIILTKRRKKTC